MEKEQADKSLERDSLEKRLPEQNNAVMPWTTRIGNGLIACLICAISVLVSGNAIGPFISGGHIDPGDLDAQTVFWLSQILLMIFGSPFYLGVGAYVLIRRVRLWPGVILAVATGIVGVICIFLLLVLSQ